MKTYKLRNFLSQFFGIWGVASILGALRNLPFPLTSGKHWAVIGFALLLIGCAIFALNKSQALQKHSGTCESDELSRAIGYTALATGMQVMTWGVFVVLMLHSVWPFLERIATEDALLGVLLFGLLAQLGSRFYYSKHPDKTGL